MKRNIALLRIFFCLFALGLTALYELTKVGYSISFESAITGIAEGMLIATLMISLESYYRRAALQLFSVIGLGLVMGTILQFCANAFLDDCFSFNLSPVAHQWATLICYLASVYAALLFSDYIANWFTKTGFFETSASLPQNVRKALVLDPATLIDSRLPDLARTGILDGQLVIPQFVMTELQKSAVCSDEGQRIKARSVLELIKKLESFPGLEMKVIEIKVPVSDEFTSSLVQAAQLIKANILTSEQNRFKQAQYGDVLVISLDALAQSLKPTPPKGEMLVVKIQRLGKEPKQGVGYLEDGTMVVVNGGGDFVGDFVRAQVLSQKYSTGGKMIFCNMLEKEDYVGRSQPSSSDIMRFEKLHQELSLSS